MDNFQLSVFAQIQAQVAIMEGMKAENVHSMQTRDCVRYGEESFNAVANELQHLAQTILNS